MERVPQRLRSWWSRLDDRERSHASVIVLAGVAYLVHTLVYCLGQPFFIEDAAISFAYAKNLVEGEGLVPFPGGERVEGYSNALWTFLNAGFYALGVPMWTSSKVLGAVFGLITLPLAYLLVRRARPDAQNHDVALLAPVMLAVSPQFVIWNTSGLENSLFCVLITAGVWRLMVEADPVGEGERERWPLSAGFFFLLCMTRPEGLMYASLAFFARLLHAVERRRAVPVLTWLVAFLVPLGLYNAWRYWYFAWELPNTYYAKLGRGNKFKPWNWSGKGGWGYTHKYLLGHGIVWLSPLLALALTGVRRSRKWLGLLLLAWLALVILWDGRAFPVDLPEFWTPIRKKWVQIRVWSIAISAVLLGLACLGLRSGPGRFGAVRGWKVRTLLWANCASGVFFVLYSNADWMSGHRWFNLVSVSLFPLLCIGLGDLLDGLGRPLSRASGWVSGRGGWVRGFALRAALVVMAGAAWTASEARHSYKFATAPETSVRDIHRRVVYMQWVQKRLDVDRILLLDVDMGAHMYFSGWRIMDIAGLIDVPFARHSDFNKKFVRDHVFVQNQPDFAHVHAGWANSSGIDDFKEWKTRYLEIPGYPIGVRKLHVGNHIRKALFVGMAPDTPPADAVEFDGGIRLLSAAVPSPEVPVGGSVFLDTSWQGGFRKHGFRLLVVFDGGDGQRAVIAAPPGYDWYSPTDWKASEAVHGRYRLPLPESLPEGVYRVGFVLIDEHSGEVMAAEGSVDASVQPWYVEGEHRSELVVRVVSADRALEHAEERHGQALALAEAGDCDAVWPMFKDATRHVLADEDWRTDRQQGIETAIAGCFVAKAARANSQDDRQVALALAHDWDHRHPDLAVPAGRLAAALSEQGDALYAAEDWEAAYTAYEAALALDPSRSWTRRMAEEARDKRLGITRPGRDKPEKSSGSSSKDADTQTAKPKQKLSPTPVRPAPKGGGARKGLQGAPKRAKGKADGLGTPDNVRPPPDPRQQPKKR